MLELAILGFLYEQPLHGYELKRRVAHLTGHVRPIADGTLYPAIKRLERAGWLERRTEPGSRAAPRHTLTLTGPGREELRRRLREADEVDISDENRWFTVLAFLRHLSSPAEQADVLRRRLAFLAEPSSFFYEGERPLGAESFDDPFRRGLLRIARATSEAELDWLAATLEELDAS
ncbi:MULTISPECIES: PadR family transcriptional regulator [Streptomyces]|uniref:PadR family transcriptional regulator n=1 Tax=Streptomyces TaxID=1883 RepID=UPI000F5B97D7|nr:MULTISPECIES: PadR family transcriptional regulator [Streptomyces]WSG52512.1 PadR family transcriptional regulator [Streptomyces sp. NBC_01732]WSX03150.1 PadR family transcriptional regulator [Streptomyces sp. NBC_00987]MCT2545883.1 PadR family transcriptional regulator [Streptomyces atratus]MCX4394892.1 PadR family transcriptional regulator [Streptomyces sp. NBC_01767]MCX4865392.1 PadR family transcriptional regulator [Streptomyces sp. NBC_00906]